MAYNIVYQERIGKDLKRIDAAQQKRILDAVRATLADAPRKSGEPLKGKYKGLWKMYVRPYRVIYRVDDREETVYVEKIGHRKDVYR